MRAYLLGDRGWAGGDRPHCLRLHDSAPSTEPARVRARARDVKRQRGDGMLPCGADEPAARMTLDDYVAWARGSAADDRALPDVGLAFAAAVGRIAEVLAAWSGDARGRARLAETLGDVAYQWARLCPLTGLAPSTLLAQSRAHVDWRRAGRPGGGPSPVTAPMALDEFAAWVRAADGADPLDDDGLVDVGLALVGDAGEVVECLRKRARGDDSRRARLSGELGDVWRYWTRLALVSGATPAELLVRSRAGWNRAPSGGTGRLP